MHVAFSAEGDERELDLDLGSGQGTIGDLVAALGGGKSGLLIDGAYWAPETPLAEVPLRQGAVLRPATGPDGSGEATKPVAVIAVAGGVAAGPSVPLGPGDHTLGRGPDADISLETPTVDPAHATVKVGADGTVVVADQGSKNGVVLEGYRCQEPVKVEAGQIIQTGAALLRAGGPPTNDAPALGRPRRNGTLAFNRPPRAMVKPIPPSLKVPGPPKDPGPGTRFNVMAMIAPVIFGVGTAVVAHNPMMASFALLAPVMMAANKMEEKRTQGKERARGNVEFNNALLAFRKALLSARQAEVARRRGTFPDPAEVLRRAEGPSVRLWERRPGHDDFLQASVGHATLAWTPLLDGASAEQPVEVDEAIQQLGWLPQAPLVVDLQPGRALGVVGDRKAALALARQTICQLAVHHGPADLRVAVLTEPGNAADWEWVKWLPHVRSLDETTGRSLLAAKPEDVLAVVDELSVAPAKSGLGGSETPSGPVTLVVVDAPQLLEGRNSPTRDVLAGSGVPAGGLVLVRTTDQLPAVCTSIVELDGAHGRARYREPAVNLTVEPLLVAGMTEAVAGECARSLSALEDPEVADVGADLPNGVALVDLVGGDVTPDALIKRWKAAGTVPRLNGPLGVAGDGPLELDLVSDGPHALIAGTTGAGKSELLRSMVAGLAATVDSEHLNFVLIDYKGGSAFAQCADLPHTVGMVTDLDEHLGSRALRCLEAELHYRETRLRDAGASDLKEYLRAGHPEPLPRLVVIIDEFATMAAELPDFIDSLVGIAQRGRSLGVHMILATQRPGGAVNDNIRANTNLRISLRVQDPAESSDIIGSPLAASIGRRQAGRGYVRLGASEVFPFQAALVTGTTRRDETVPIKVNRFVFGPDPVLADTAAAAAATAPSTPEGPTDLEKLVAAAAEAAQVEGLAVPRRPWPETLPAVLSQAELVAEAGGEAAARIGVGPAYGLADEPDHQRRALFCWSPVLGNAFVCGVAGSGTTETLGSMAVALGREYRPEKLWLYALDFGTQALAPLAGLPHCGGVIGSADRERQFRLVRYLADELERRRKHVATSGAVKIDPADPNSPFPAIVLLIDNYGALSAAWEDGPGMQIKDILTRTIADGPGLGVVAVISTDRPLSLPGALGSVIPNKMALRLADPSDLSFFGLNPREVGKLGFGRGVDAATKLEVQVANAHADGLAAAVSETVTAMGEIDAATRPPAIGTLPDEVPIALVAERLQVGAAGDWFLPVGISDSTLAPAGLRMAEGEHVLIAGAARSGKSTTLEAIAAMVAAAHPEVVITAVAVRRSPLQETPEVRRLVKAAGDIDGAVTELLADTAPQLVLIDDADALPDTPTGALANLVGTTRPDVHVVVAGRGDTLRSDYMHWSVKVRNSRQGLCLKPDDMDANLWNSSFPREKPHSFPPGRGYLIVDGVPDLVQAARRA